MDSRITNRLARLFEQTNGHSQHPLDTWIEWIAKKHPEFVDQCIDEVKARKDLTDDDLPAAYVACATALSFASTQLMFDVVTGAIFGPEHESYSPGEVLHNLEQVRERSHELVNQVFDQYTEEYQECVKVAELAQVIDNDDESENDFDDLVVPLEGDDDPKYNMPDDDFEEHEWEEVEDEDDDIDDEDKWKDGKIEEEN